MEYMDEDERLRRVEEFQAQTQVYREQRIQSDKTNAEEHQALNSKLDTITGILNSQRGFVKAILLVMSACTAIVTIFHEHILGRG